MFSASALSSFLLLNLFCSSIDRIQACKNVEFECDLSNEEKEGNSKYFLAMRNIYSDYFAESGLQKQMQCGWKSDPKRNDLPLFVLAVGLEGAGHHLYSELFKEPVFDCLWVI